MHHRIPVLGIAGTAKNTGKTTTLNSLLQEAARRNLSAAVTGIGYDGEELDNVTRLPKPRVSVFPNSIVTTSEQCLNISTASFDILHRTGMFTSLGEIVILRVRHPGMIVIAGPGKSTELYFVIEKMRQYDVDCIFVDGSLNRITPMSVVQSVIFTTGASRSTDIATVSSEISAIEHLLRLPPPTVNVPSEIFEQPMVLEASDADALLSAWNIRYSAVHISNLISLPALERLAARCAGGSVPMKELIVTNPFSLLVNGNAVQTFRYISELMRSQISVTCRNRSTLSCITANPFFPELIGNKYRTRYIDKNELVQRLQESCSSPVFNTQETEPAVLFDTCIS